MARRRGGYQPPAQARDSHRARAERRRAPQTVGLVIPAVRHGRLLAAPTTGTGMRM